MSNIHESGEDYLETILILEKRHGYARSVEIAAEMQVSKASVSVAMKNLKNGGYILMNGNYEITLTPRGREVAETIYERHVLFSEVLIKLGVHRDVALRDACRMEHIISRESFTALKQYFTENPPGEESPSESGDPGRAQDLKGEFTV